MFDAVGFVTDELDALPQMPITVYRGARKDRPRGFSWTWNRSLADWFAQRGLAMFGYPTAVYTLTLPKEMLLALIGGTEGRGEREVVVNPRRLRGRWTPREIATHDTEDPTLPNGKKLEAGGV